MPLALHDASCAVYLSRASPQHAELSHAFVCTCIRNGYTQSVSRLDGRAYVGPTSVVERTMPGKSGKCIDPFLHVLAHMQGIGAACLELGPTAAAGVSTLITVHAHMSRQIRLIFSSVPTKTATEHISRFLFHVA